MGQTTNIAKLKQTSKMVARDAGIGSVKQFFESQKATLATVLPRHVSPDRMLKIALGALRTTPKLMECTVESLMGAVVQCSQLGLEPNTPLGHAYLIPFEKKKKVGGEWVTEKVETQIVIGYKGLIDLARRSGQVVSIAAHAVYEHDHFDYAFGLNEKLEHKPAMSARGRVIAFYAVAKLVGGGHAFEVMSAEQVNEIRDASQNYKFARDKEKTVWGQHYEEMGRKTVLRRLFKYLPVSIELASAAALDDVGASGRSQALDTVLDGDYITPTDDEPDDDGVIDPPAGLIDQRQQQRDMTLPSYDDLLSQIQNAKDEEVLALVLDSARDLPQTEYVKLEQAYQDRREVLLNA
ncbi:recombinase RecT [Burkholderia multivorans]|uniref:Recombinase RecT n=1 Tax=Burkholderia multivorans TaxID=87883 RepID=A0A8E2RRL9_9BURK|nr:recombinase RecT [Burkholderia multivorans]MDN8088722.1 recombinase RecT [Burkholderia multivorans]MDN8094694.1 recombinase RecT [Burkholderia multivorans]MDN8107777.1 recombinase RecT [Burkholderia multivorans]MDN8126179.1 recombinase RecT [Burkholderia multivorans]MDN8130716.1 recombinase RecT [Burkholderia multivorans]